MPRTIRRESARIAAIYAAFGAAWILFSDRVALWLVRDPERLTQLQTYKGWAYVVLTAALLYVLVRRSLARLRAAEERARQLQKLEVLGRMAGGVAHDFNNIITVQMASAELLGLALAPGHHGRHALDDLLSASERGRRLVRRLMAYARRRPEAAQRLDLALQLREAEPLLRKLLRSGQTLEVHAAPAVVLADPEQIDQILMNLVVNAGDAIGEGGRVAIRGGVEGGHAVLTVEDDGPGIPPDIQPRIFDPFFSTKGAEGTGLGLATVWANVQQLGGGIHVENGPGRGARFVIEIPLAGPAA